MTPKRYVARSSEIAARRLGNEMMIMSGKDSTLFSLNEVATVIWEAADGLELGEALRDAEALAEALAGHGLLLLSDKPFQSVSALKEQT